MIQVLLAVHILIALAMVGVVLIQRSEGGGLGIGGGNAGGFMTTRGTANLLTRTTAIIAGLFMATSLALAYLATSERAPVAHSILDTPAAPSAPAPTPPAQPAAPSVPLAR
jgi:preprotein translocase subunit SecG